MRTSLKKSEYFLAATLALIAAFPMAVEPPMLSPEVSLAAMVSGTTIQQTARANYSDYRQNRRDYAEAKALCIQLRKGGNEVTCPDINDAAGIQYFLGTHKNLPTAKTLTGTVVLHMEDLNTYEMNLMRRYLRINTCPQTLKTFLPGFYELCVNLVNPNPKLYKGTTFDTESSVENIDLDEFIKAHQSFRHIH